MAKAVVLAWAFGFRRSIQSSLFLSLLSNHDPHITFRHHQHLSHCAIHHLNRQHRQQQTIVVAVIICTIAHACNYLVMKDSVLPTQEADARNPKNKTKPQHNDKSWARA